MTEFRWYSSRHVVTAAKVRRYCDEHGVSMEKAKSTLEQATKPRLQYKNDGIGAWQDVPHVVEVFE